MWKFNAGYFAANESEKISNGDIVTDGITAIAAGSFDVGAGANVNTSTGTYRYYAFYDDGNGDFEIGSYTGDGGAATRDITGLGFDEPECVIVSEDATVEKWWHSISHG